MSDQQAQDIEVSAQAMSKPSPNSRETSKASKLCAGTIPSATVQRTTTMSNVKETHLLASIETSKSKITDIEGQLSIKLQEFSKLKSFPAEQEGLNEMKEITALGHAQSIINKHISLLKRYNNIKDIALKMLDLIAEKEGKRLAEVMEERSVSEKD